MLEGLSDNIDDQEERDGGASGTAARDGAPVADQVFVDASGGRDACCGGSAHCSGSVA